MNRYDFSKYSLLLSIFMMACTTQVSLGPSSLDPGQAEKVTEELLGTIGPVVETEIPDAILAWETSIQVLTAAKSPPPAAERQVASTPEDRLESVTSEIHHNQKVIKQGKVRLRMAQMNYRQYKNRFKELKKTYKSHKKKTKEFNARLQSTRAEIKKLKSQNGDPQKISAISAKVSKYKRILSRLTQKKFLLIGEFKKIKRQTKELLAHSKKEREYLSSVHQQTQEMKLEKKDLKKTSPETS